MIGLLTEIEAARLLRITTRRLNGLVHNALIPHVTLPGMPGVRFDPIDLYEWIEARKNTTEKEAVTNVISR